mmetsp:Transcript_37659/g.94418  ORF Transcript_37659/g.94418 Transcript_37659/m.94418 type:complete len:204 (+) Transcript_37659:1186-1797(+)
MPTFASSAGAQRCSRRWWIFSSSRNSARSTWTKTPSSSFRASTPSPSATPTCIWTSACATAGTSRLASLPARCLSSSQPTPTCTRSVRGLFADFSFTPLPRYKTNAGTEDCGLCPVNTYNAKRGASLLSECVACWDESTTKKIEGATGPDFCLCKDDFWFMPDENYNQTGLGVCVDCPTLAMCDAGNGTKVPRGALPRCRQRW